MLLSVFYKLLEALVISMCNFVLYVVSAGRVKTIELQRGPDGLGFSIVGGFGSPHGDLPIYIKTVFTKGAATVSGELKRGDQIIAVNGESLDGATHEQAVDVLKRAKGEVIMTVLA